MLFLSKSLEEEQVVGEVLKKRRGELGKDLKEIAHTLKIRYDYLRAIEDEAFEKLPVEVYAKGYIRDYARFLNIDPEIIIRAYIEKTSPPVIEKPPVPVDTAQIKKTRIKYFLAAIILIAIGVYVLFSFAPEKPKIMPHETTMLPVSPVPAAPSELPIIQPVQPAQKEEGITVQISEEEKTEKVMKEHVLEISAIDTTWLLVNIDDTASKDMLLKEGETVKLSAKQGFSLKIGNAGGTKLIFDGKDIGSLGEKGQVINLNLPSDKNQNPDSPKTE